MYNPGVSLLGGESLPTPTTGTQMDIQERWQCVSRAGLEPSEEDR
jgi:hypothetical protein